MHHVQGQRLLGGLGIGPGFGGQHFDALRQQHRCLALHLHPVLQIFDGAHALDQLGFQAGQRLFAEWRAGFGGIALPGQGIGQVELAQGQQSLGLVGPFKCNGGLRFAALDVVELFTQQFGSALVLAAEFLEHLLQLVGARTGRQPFANAGHALTRGLLGKRTQRHGIERMRLGGFGADGRCVRSGGCFVLGRKREHRHRALDRVGAHCQAAGINAYFRRVLALDQKNNLRRISTGCSYTSNCSHWSSTRGAKSCRNSCSLGHGLLASMRSQ